MKKLLALLLALAMVFSLMLCLTACDDSSSSDDDDDEKSSSKKDDEDEDDDKDDEDDNKDDEDTDKDDEDEDDKTTTSTGIVGTWEGTVDLSDFFAMYGMDFLSVKSFKVGLIFEFEKNGEYTMYVNESDWDKAVDKNMDSWIEAFEESLEDEYGMSAEDFEDETGMTPEEYMISVFEEDITADSIYLESKYELEDDILYLKNDGTYQIDLSSKEFEFVAGDEDSQETFEMIYEGVVFKRQ